MNDYSIPHKAKNLQKKDSLNDSIYTNLKVDDDQASTVATTHHGKTNSFSFAKSHSNKFKINKSYNLNKTVQKFTQHDAKEKLYETYYDPKMTRVKPLKNSNSYNMLNLDYAKRCYDNRQSSIQTFGNKTQSGFVCQNVAKVTLLDDMNLKQKNMLQTNFNIVKKNQTIENKFSKRNTI